jgi:hypothetical protein
MVVLEHFTAREANIKLILCQIKELNGILQN